MRSSMKFIVFATASCMALFSGMPARGTVVTADGFASSQDCGWGLQTVTGFHSATINLISEEHLGKDWNLEGLVWSCDFFLPQRITSTCLVSGNTLATQWLTCNTRKDVACFRVGDGVRSQDSAIIVNFPETSTTHRSSCTVSLSCDEDPKL